MASIEFISSPRSSSEQTIKAGYKSSLRLNHKRNLANLRERKRMMLINKGFELLRNRLPIRELIDNVTNVNLKTKLRGERWTEFSSESGKRSTLLEPNGKLRLTKVDILKLTIEYIKQLNNILTGSTGQANTSNLSIDRNRYIKSTRMSKKSLHHHKKYRNRRQYSKRAQKRQQQQQQQIQEFSNLKQTTSHLFVYARPNVNFDGRIEDDIVRTTSKRYLLSCSRLTDKYDCDQLMDQNLLHSNGERSSGLKNTKLWIPDIE